MFSRKVRTTRHHMKILLIFFICFISATLGYFGDPSGRTLDIGDYKTCVVLNDAQGSVKCFGMAADGQLGTGSQKNVGLTPNTTPLKLPPIQLGGKALYVSSGYKHTCVLMETQNIRCFGLGHSGRLGYGSEVSLANDPSTVPAAVGDVPLGVKVQQVACGTASTCVIHSGGKVRCWGLGFRGILGDGKTDTIGGKPNLLPRDQPDVDLGGLQAVDIATSAHACVIVALATQPGLQHGVGQLYCWGSNGEGQLGYGHTDSLGGTPETVPIKNGPVPVGAMVRQVDVGLYHTCVVTETHTLRCWGSNQYGQLGYGKAGNLGNQPDTTPAQVGDVPMGGKKVLRVATGAWHTCVLLDDHTVKCWGRGSTGSGPAGPIGYGDDEYMIEFGYIPVTPAQLRPIALGGKAALIRSGRGHTCAIMLEAGAAEDDEDAHTRMKCWGWGAFGALGYGERESVGQVPKKLPKDMNVVPVEPIKPDPWLVADATTELELRPFGGHGASLPFEKPPHRAASFLLWTLPPLALLVVCCDVVLYMRKGNSFSSYLRRGQSRGSGKFD